MSSAGKKLIAGARAALSFARGDCEHEWAYITSTDYAASSNQIKRVSQCLKCGVRVTTFSSTEGSQ